MQVSTFPAYFHKQIDNFKSFPFSKKYHIVHIKFKAAVKLVLRNITLYLKTFQLIFVPKINFNFMKKKVYQIEKSSDSAAFLFLKPLARNFENLTE
jgi:hypothetical protein